MVRVETWFGGTGEKPKTGQVEVRSDNGALLVKGQLSSQGLFLFEAPEGQPLQVVIEAGEGHRAEVPIKPEELMVAQVTEKAVATPAPQPPPSHEERLPLKDIVTGIGLLVAVAAFVLSLRNARRIRELEGGAATRR
jgi:nickel transport protein